MIELYNDGAIWSQGRPKPVGPEEAQAAETREKRSGTIARRIIDRHRIDRPAAPGADTAAEGGKLQLKFDCLASHDITYVGIIQTARASGLKEFPVPYVLTNCHNSLCAVGGTIN